MVEGERRAVVENVRRPAHKLVEEGDAGDVLRPSASRVGERSRAGIWTHSATTAIPQAAAITQPRRRSTMPSHASTHRISALPTSSSSSSPPLPAAPAPILLPPDHAPPNMSIQPPWPPGLAVAGSSNVGRAAISRQSMMVGTVDGPPWWMRNVGSVKVDSRTGSRRASVR